jgi:hypothetical protein
MKSAWNIAETSMSIRASTRGAAVSPTRHRNRPGGETTFAERVLLLLADDELCRHVGLAARAKAEQEFGLGSLVDETLNAYRAAGWRDA